MMIHEITEKVGAHKKRKRVGRGRASGLGKPVVGPRVVAPVRVTVTRSTSKVAKCPCPSIAQRGFTNAAFRTDYQVVNVHVLCSRFEDGAEVNAEVWLRKDLSVRSRSLSRFWAKAKSTRSFR